MSWGAIMGIGSIAASVGSALFGKDKKTQTTQNVEDSFTKGEQLKQFGEQQLSDQLLGQLEGLFTTALDSGGFQAGQNSLYGRLAQLNSQAQEPQFDVAGFAKGVRDSAATGINFSLEDQINGLASNIGGSESGNSMAALLGNRMRTDATKELAGIETNAFAAGEQIRQAQQAQLTSGIQGLTDSAANQILSLINSTSGQRTAGTATTAEERETQTKVKSTGSSTSKANPFEAFSNAFSVLGNSSLNA